MDIRELVPAVVPAWDAYVARHPQAKIYHRAVWRRVPEKVFGHRTRYLYAQDGKAAIRGVLPLVHMHSRLFGRLLVSLPYVNYGGVVADDASVAEALIAAARREAATAGMRWLELRGWGREQCAFPRRHDKVAMVRPLPDSADRLWQALGSKLRAQIKRPLRENVTVEQGGPELIDAFYAVFARNMRDLGTPVYPPRFFREVVASLAQEATVFVLRARAVPVAAALVVRDGGTLEVPWAASRADWKAKGVNMMLYWELLRHGIALGCERFDFGRSTRGGGTYRFKRQWGAEEVPLYWHYWRPDGGAVPNLSPSNSRFGTAVALWKRLPLPIANVLGPAIVRGIP